MNEELYRELERAKQSWEQEAGELKTKKERTLRRKAGSASGIQKSSSAVVVLLAISEPKVKRLRS